MKRVKMKKLKVSSKNDSKLIPIRIIAGNYRDTSKRPDCQCLLQTHSELNITIINRRPAQVYFTKELSRLTEDARLKHINMKLFSLRLLM